MHKVKKVLKLLTQNAQTKINAYVQFMTFYLSFFPIFSNGMDVDGLHIRVDLTGQNNKVILSLTFLYSNLLSINPLARKLITVKPALFLSQISCHDQNLGKHPNDFQMFPVIFFRLQYKHYQKCPKIIKRLLSSSESIYNIMSRTKIFLF